MAEKEKSDKDYKLAIRQIKEQHQKHLAKSTYKVEADTELLEVLKEYAQKRADIEQTYSKSMDKLSKSLLQRKFRKYLGPNPTPLQPNGLADEAEDVAAPPAPVAEQRLVCRAITTLLAESDVQAAKHNRMAEDFGVRIADVIKEYTRERGALTKKNADYGTRYHQELAQSLDELDRKRIAYTTASKEVDAAKKKYEDASKRPKSGFSGLKTLLTGVDAVERTQKIYSKFKYKSRYLTDCRNEYLLALLSTNALQQKYFDEDLPSLLVKFDGKLFGVLQQTFDTYGSLEKDLAVAMNQSVAKISADASKITREKDNEYFLKENTSLFTAPADFYLENVGEDTFVDLVVDEVTRVTLGQALGSLIYKDKVLAASKAVLEKEQEGVKTLLQAYADNPSFGSAVAPFEQKQELGNQIDLLNAQRYAISAQIKALEALEIVPIEPIVEINGKLLEAYTAKNKEELSAVKDEEITVLEEVDGFFKVKNKSGTIGLIPTNLVERIKKPEPLLNSTSSKNVKALYDYNSNDETELTFKAGDTIECVEVYPDEDWWVGKLARTGEKGAFPKNFTSGWEAVAASSHGTIQRKPSTTGTTRSVAPSLYSEPAKLAAIPAVAAAIVEAKALYNYEATCDGELSIVAGETIKIINKDTGSDAWWEGQGSKGTGQFPSNYVQEISGDVPRTQHSTLKVRALYDFVPTAAGEIGFLAGDIIEVTKSDSEDWWDGVVNGESGAFPANYVETI